MSKQTNFLDRDSVLHALRQQLEENADPKTKESGPKFFKEQVTLYGVKTAIVTKISKEYFNYLKDGNENDVFLLCEDLWKSDYLEESFVACNWSYALHKQFSPEDFFVFEKWLSFMSITGHLAIHSVITPLEHWSGCIRNNWQILLSGHNRRIAGCAGEQQ